MQNKVHFTVQCRLHPGREESLCVSYVKQDRTWIPLPPNICDNGCGEDACRQCVVTALQQALAQQPPFDR